MHSKSASKQLHRIPTGLVVAIALVLLVVSVAFAMLFAIDRSTNDTPAARKSASAVVHPRENPRFSEINELHYLREPDSTQRAESAATVSRSDRMKFAEMNVLLGGASLVPPPMEMYAERQ